MTNPALTSGHASQQDVARVLPPIMTLPPAMPNDLPETTGTATLAAKAAQLTPGAESTVQSEYLLLCRAEAQSLDQGRWFFSLEAADGSPVFAAGDEEWGDLNRLTLLAAVRGLESIDGASAVTLLSSNRYLIRSLSDSLPRWRENDFVWEHFGRRIDVQHADLWRRVDRALSIHRVEACLISSRLVSSGMHRHACPALAEADADAPQLRVDTAHVDSGAGGVPVRRRRRPGQTRSVSQRGDGPQWEAQPDSLRRWLMGGSGTRDAAPPRRRFTAADLLSA